MSISTGEGKESQGEMVLQLTLVWCSLTVVWRVWFVVEGFLNGKH